MPRYTPLYGLAALDPSDKLRTIADTDWANAQTVEQILANQGQPPLASDLVSMIKRLNVIEALQTPRPFFEALGKAGAQAYTSGWALLNAALVPAVAEKNTFDWNAGVLTCKRAGVYQFWIAGQLGGSGTDRTNRGLEVLKNSTAIDGAGMIVKLEAGGLGVSTSFATNLAAGDALRFYFLASGSGSISAYGGGDTYVRAAYMGPVA